MYVCICIYVYISRSRSASTSIYLSIYVHLFINLSGYLYICTRLHTPHGLLVPNIKPWDG